MKTNKTKKQPLTKNYYDGIAKGYSNLYHEEQICKISLIKEYIPQTGLTLDLGSGDGVINQFILKSQIISLDLSYELLKLNKNKTKILASAQNLPFKNNTFDYIISFTMLQDIPQPIKVLEEVKRVAKKNATIILSFLKLSSKSEEIIYYIRNNYEIIKELEEMKDHIFVLKV